MIVIRQKGFSSKAQKVLKNKFLASYVKPGYSVPKSKVREYLKNKAPEINNKGDLINWGINVKAAESGGIAGARSTHFDSTGVTKNNKFYDHRESNVTKNKGTMRFVRDVINKNKK